jgi:hypothetical protein
MIVYRGAREPDGGVVVTADGRPLDPEPSMRVRRYTRGGFDWGFAGGGPAQLALAILLDVTGDPAAAERNRADFQRQFVVGWGERWEVTARQVRDWLAMSDTLDQSLRDLGNPPPV